MGRKAQAKAKREAIDPRQLMHLKKLRHLLPLLSSLRDSGCARDAAGNRDLHVDEYVTLVLLYLFNPMIDSLRTLQRAAAIDKLAEQLGVRRFSLGSFSESCRAFEPEKLRAVIARLAGELRPLHADPRLRQHLGGPALTIADGTVLDAISKVADAFWLKFKDGSPKHAWKLHVQFEVETLCPAADGVELTDARNSGKSDEKNVLRSAPATHRCASAGAGPSRVASAAGGAPAGVGAGGDCPIRGSGHGSAPETIRRRRRHQRASSNSAGRPTIGEPEPLIRVVG